MKKIFTLGTIALFTTASFAQVSPTVTATPPTDQAPAVNPNAGTFKFGEETFDFGTVPQGTPVTHEFTFENTGKEPIVIKNVQASCGCTTPTWPKEPVLPGKTAVISATYNAANPGSFTKSITVTSNATEPTKVLYIKGTVKEKPKDQTTPEKQPSIVNEPHN